MFHAAANSGIVICRRQVSCWGCPVEVELVDANGAFALYYSVDAFGHTFTGATPLSGDVPEHRVHATPDLWLTVSGWDLTATHLGLHLRVEARLPAQGRVTAIDDDLVGALPDREVVAHTLERVFGD